MQNNFLFVDITEKNIHILEQFLLNAGNILDSFRYFNKRKLSVIKNHICTYVLMQNDLPLGYGHLDKEDNIIWLGIAIKEKEQGKGLGKLMMQKLFNEAVHQKIKKINLSVDEENKHAIKLYKKLGFVEIKKINKILYFAKEL